MRADKFFSEKYGSRTKASEAIEKGLVLVNGKQIKSKYEIKETDVITFVTAEESFVSNGGYKLHRALKTFVFNCSNLIFADIGASTGGFTHCLLINGAKHVFAVDVGESLLHESLLGDSRITQMENVNARYLSKGDFAIPVQAVVTDVSFISLRLIFPPIANILDEGGDALVLIKPQFECENKHIGKSGIVHNSAHAKIIEKVLSYASDNGLYPFGITTAPIRKGKNIEYVLWVKPTYQGAKSVKMIVDEATRLIKEKTE